MYIYKLIKSRTMKLSSLKPVIGLVTLLLMVSCEIKPEAIEYGNDQCSYCVMNIVDKTHAAQYVTSKGKQFKFDAIECMVNDLKDKNESDLAFKLVSNYQNPGSMLNADDASYIISEEIKSPMGANLSAVSSIEIARELQQKHTGETYSWVSLKQQLSDK